jgi:hypothetical protein
VEYLGIYITTSGSPSESWKPLPDIRSGKQKNYLTEPKLAGPKNMTKIQDSFRFALCNIHVLLLRNIYT